MKRKGISLIVLIITIIVILILAAAILLSIAKANPILNAKKAVSKNDVQVAQEAVTMWIGDRWVREKEGTVGEEVGALYTGIVTKEPSDVEVNLDGEKSTIQITLEELGLEMLEEVEIKNNRVISITENGKKQEGDISGGDQGSNVPDDSIIVKKEEYEKLKNNLEELKNKVTEKEGKISALEVELEEVRKEVLNGKILEQGTQETGTFAPASNKEFTINLKNTYTEEDHARIVIYRGEILSGEPCLKVLITEHDGRMNNIIIGNSYTFNIQNVSGSGRKPRKYEALLLCSELSRIA